jgi:hypothetical protein
MILGMLVTVMLLATVGPVMAAMGPPGKVDICHLDGHGTYHLIRVSERALPAHLRHGDVQPGTIVAVGEPYTGMYGSTVTPITTVGDDCSSSTMLKVVSSTLYYAAGGWAGWSCVESGYPKAVNGGFLPETATPIAYGLAVPGATIGGFTYPVFPHYTFPAGETGYVVQGAGPGKPTNVVVYCSL